jgi:cyclopropane-fatty-acyl-phospholipid synthase
MESTIAAMLPVVESGAMPDFAVRQGIRMLLRSRLEEISAGSVEQQQERTRAFLAELDTLPIAINTADANVQHYEVPTAFYSLCLGARKKYSSCIWASDCTSLEQAEVASLKQVRIQCGANNDATLRLT